MKQISLVLAFSFAMFVLAGCTSVSVFVPSARVEAPDVPGVTKINFGSSVLPGREVKFTDDASNRPPTISNEPLDGSAYYAGGNFGAGLGRRFEVGVSLGADTDSSGCIGAMGKFQIFGEPHATAKQDDFPVAIFAHAQACGNESSGDQDRLFGPGGYDWSAHGSSGMGDVGLSFGYRATERMMIYAGGAYGAARATFKLHQDETSSGSPEADYGGACNGNLANGTVGLKFSWQRIWFDVKGAYSHITMKGQDPDQLEVAGNFTFQLK